MKYIGKGIAVAGIWIGVGIISISSTGQAITAIAFFGMIATAVAVMFWSKDD